MRPRHKKQIAPVTSARIRLIARETPSRLNVRAIAERQIMTEAPHRKPNLGGMHLGKHSNSGNIERPAKSGGLRELQERFEEKLLGNNELKFLGKCKSLQTDRIPCFVRNLG